ncbi:MAG: hypothetical protein HYX65_04860 [Gemmatimonadetes bacterium]|nr:hypothetical protein [Gemmatimonadota bacterium]
MSTTNSESLERLAKPIYFVGLLLILTPLADFITSVWPLQPREIRWRFASVALLGGFLFTPLLGSTLALFLATVLEHRGTQRLMAIFNILVSVILVAMLIGLSFDTLQLRKAVPPDAQTAFRTSAVRAAFKHGSVALAALWLGVVGLRMAAKASRDEARRERPRMTGPVVVTGTGQS